jgi:hypothetical protein
MLLGRLTIKAKSLVIPLINRIARAKSGKDSHRAIALRSDACADLSALLSVVKG